MVKNFIFTYNLFYIHWANYEKKVCGKKYMYIYVHWGRGM